MVKSVLADDGLSDANLVHAGDPRRLGELFGTDSVMYISIERWDAKYVILATTVTVELNYSLKSAHTYRAGTLEEPSDRGLPAAAEWRGRPCGFGRQRHDGMFGKYRAEY